MIKANDPLKIGPSDVGRHVFTVPDIDPDDDWLNEFEIDTEAVIVSEEPSGRLGYVYIRSARANSGVNFAMSATMVIVLEGERLYATQAAAIRAAVESERSYAKRILDACELVESSLDTI